MSVDVTVVIPTYRRPERLLRLLAALAGEQGDFAWDVLVVDNDPQGRDVDAIASAIAGFLAQRNDISISSVAEPQPGAAHARNRGITDADGEIIAMLDDDVVPQPGWLAAICLPVITGQAGGTGGRVVLDPSVERPKWFDDEAVGAYLTAHDLGPKPHQMDYFSELVVTANAAFRRDLLLRVGGFDPAFGPRGKVQIVCDDAHLTRQIIALGFDVLWVPDAVCIHDAPPDRLRLKWLLKRAWWQGRSDWRLERLELSGRRFGGRMAGGKQISSWLRVELKTRRSEGLGHAPVVVHAACDLSRMAGRATEVLRNPVGGSQA